MRPLEREFSSRSVVPGGFLMLRPVDAIDLVRAARKQGAPVLHIEGFLLYPGGDVRPSPEQSLTLGDVSQDVKAANNCWDLAEKFLVKCLSKSFFFNIALPWVSETMGTGQGGPAGMATDADELIQDIKGALAQSPLPAFAKAEAIRARLWSEGKENPIEREFRRRNVGTGGLLILRPADAMEMVWTCRERGVEVQHVEGFLLYPGGGTQPSMEHTIVWGKDVSKDVDAENSCWNLAEKFLAKYLATSFFFNLTLPGTGDMRDIDVGAVRSTATDAESLVQTIESILAQSLSASDKIHAVQRLFQERTKGFGGRPA